jgi:uncharacterized protein (TIGR03435 family)
VKILRLAQPAASGAIFCLLAAPFSPAQTPAAKPTFEVASIKPAKHSAHPIFEVTPGGNVMWQTSIGPLIRIAYKVKPPFQIYGATPGWLESDEYLIEAKSPDGLPPINPSKLPEATDFLLRLQSLLGERFHLAAHHENRDTPVYVLVVAKNGPKLKAADASQMFRLRKAGKGAILNEGPAKIGLLVSLLANNFDRPVLDETGLTGSYSFNLTWTPDAPAGAPAQATAAGDPGGPTLFTALQEQLGLKLEASRRPVEVLVIDHIERPTEN